MKKPTPDTPPGAHENFMKMAVALAAQHSARGDNGPFGAVIVRNDKVIGEGWNRVVETRDPTAHAEILAIRDACARLDRNVLNDCVLYSSCEPCPMCLAAVYWARIPVFYYASTRHDARDAGFDDAFLYQELQAAPAQRRVQALHLPVAEAARVFAQWRENTARIPY